jgi:RimJ/RimL family protein N-acetyltransferase
MTVIIRKAIISDAEQMANIHARSWEAAYANIIPQNAIAETNARRSDLWNRILSKEGGSFKFAICNGEKVIGLLTFGESRDEDADTNTLEIYSIYLLPEYLGKGFGKSAMDFVNLFAKNNGYIKITLWVLEENYRARRFYEKCGYAFDGTEKELFIGKLLKEIRYTTIL